MACTPLLPTQRLGAPIRRSQRRGPASGLRDQIWIAQRLVSVERSVAGFPGLKKKATSINKKARREAGLDILVAGVGFIAFGDGLRAGFAAAPAEKASNPKPTTANKKARRIAGPFYWLRE